MKLKWSSRVYLGLLAPFRMLAEAHYLNKTVRVFQAIPGSTSIFLRLSTTVNNLQNHSVQFRSFQWLSRSTNIFLAPSAIIHPSLTFSYLQVNPPNTRVYHHLPDGMLWSIVNLADSVRKILDDPGSWWLVLEVTEGFSGGGLLRKELWRVLKDPGRSWRTRRSFQFPPNMDQLTPQIANI